MDLNTFEEVSLIRALRHQYCFTTLSFSPFIFTVVLSSLNAQIISSKS